MISVWVNGLKLAPEAWRMHTQSSCDGAYVEH